MAPSSFICNKFLVFDLSFLVKKKSLIHQGNFAVRYFSSRYTVYVIRYTVFYSFFSWTTYYILPTRYCMWVIVPSQATKQSHILILGWFISSPSP